MQTYNSVNKFVQFENYIVNKYIISTLIWNIKYLNIFLINGCILYIYKVYTLLPSQPILSSYCK